MRAGRGIARHVPPPRNSFARAAFPSTMNATPSVAEAAEPGAWPLHECPDCGLFQALTPIRPGQVAECDRCGAVLRRRRRNSIGTTLALAITGLMLIGVAAGSNLLTFRMTGQERETSLVHLPVAFEDEGMPLLAVPCWRRRSSRRSPGWR